MICHQPRVKAINHYPEYNIFVSWKSELSTPKQQISPLLIEPVTAHPWGRAHLLPFPCEGTERRDGDHQYKGKSSAWRGGVAWLHHVEASPQGHIFDGPCVMWWSSFHVTKNRAVNCHLSWEAWHEGRGLRGAGGWTFSLLTDPWSTPGWGQACFSRNHIWWSSEGEGVPGTGQC